MRYYGGKEKLLEQIGGVIKELPLSKKPTVLDLFSGTAVVARRLKQIGFRVTANDWLYFCKCLATSRVVLDAKPSFNQIDCDPIRFLNSLPGSAGFFSESYSPYGLAGRRYFTAENAGRIDAIRLQIEQWKDESLLSEQEYEYLLAALLEAMNRTSNVSGTYAAYLKSWDPRALKAIELEYPPITVGSTGNTALNEDAFEVAKQYQGDVIYMDPPYNTRQYSSNYFLLDVVAKGWFADKPAVRGVTGMRDNSALQSRFSMKRLAREALSEIIEEATSPHIVLSYSNEGLIPHHDVISLLKSHGGLVVHEIPHRRYRAINHDPSKKTTIEYLYVLSKG